jgi:CRP-like cAMP-binding protein
VMKYIRVHKHVYDIFQVLVLVVTTLHVGACIWMAILNPCQEERYNYAGDVLCSQDKIYTLYAEAFHLSTTMILGVSNTHVISDHAIMNLLTYRHDEDRVIMYVISSVFMVLGLVLIALLIGEMTVYLMGIMQGSAAFQRKIDRVNHEMEYYAVPDNLQRQVRAFYDYVWIHQKQYDHRIALLSDDNMSTDLQRKLALHLYKDVISHISIFSDIDDLLLGEICLSLRTRIFLPHDMIIFKGDIGKELFIISKGVVEVLRDDLPPEKQLHAPPIMLHSGSFFGEIALIMEVRRTCSVQARTICEVNLLEQKAFDSILRDNPEFARRMNELVVVRQLERTMARNSQKGVDYQISKDDYDRAFTAVSKHMKEGLERRMKSSNREKINPRMSHYVDDVIGGNIKCSDCHVDESDSDRESLSSVQSEGIRRSFYKKQQPDVIEHVSQILTDITRRSTRFANENSKPRRKYGSMKGSASCSDGEIDIGRYDSSFMGSATNTTNPGVGKRRRKSMLEFSGDCRRATLTDISLGKEYENMQAAGNFNPDKSVVDIKKVHPSILSQGGNTTTHSSCDSKIKVFFEVHDAFMSKLLRKLEKIESWLCGNGNRSNEAPGGARPVTGKNPPTNERDPQPTLS